MQGDIIKEEFSAESKEHAKKLYPKGFNVIEPTTKELYKSL